MVLLPRALVGHLRFVGRRHSCASMYSLFKPIDLRLQIHNFLLHGRKLVNIDNRHIMVVLHRGIVRELQGQRLFTVIAGWKPTCLNVGTRIIDRIRVIFEVMGLSAFVLDVSERVILVALLPTVQRVDPLRRSCQVVHDMRLTRCLRNIIISWEVHVGVHHRQSLEPLLLVVIQVLEITNFRTAGPAQHS